MEDDPPYRFKQLPLTPAVIEFLVSELFSGQLVERQAIIEKVLPVHLARGGKNADAQSVTHSVKKALKNMLVRGLAENPAIGHWRIIRSDSVAESTASVGLVDQSPDDDVAEVIAEALPRFAPTPADVTLGTGSGTIYLYYLPTYRHFSELRGEAAWPCKIGRTDRDPLERILAQAATALPELPRVATILRTPVPAAWEAAVHGILTIRGRKMKDSPGMEWFLTSPDEVLQIIRLIDPGLPADGD